MIRAWSVSQVRAAERACAGGDDDAALMQQAAAGLSTVIASLLRQVRGGVVGARVVLLAGSGGNGGDALWAGARLARRGAVVVALLAGSRAHPAGLAALRKAGGEVLALGELPEEELAGAVESILARADVTVDALVGIGARPGLSGVAAALVAAIPADLPVVAVDLPSGVDPDSGTTPGTHVRADVTVTFGAVKPCLLLDPAAAAAGSVQVVDIGLEPHLSGAPAVERLGEQDAGSLWPVPRHDDDKYARGVVGVVAGSAAYTGAAVLCVGGALGAGAGMVRYVGAEHPTELVRQRWPEVVPGPGRVQAWALGSGTDVEGMDAEQERLIREALTSGEPCVADAGALGIVARLVHDHGGAHPAAGGWLLTPHAGELARLLTDLGQATSRDQVSAAPLEHARRASEMTGATVLLKGATTLVVPPAGTVRSQAEGPGWLATAGAGDVLAGIAGALLAGGLGPLDAGSLAAFVHGRAAERVSGGGPLRALDIVAAVPGVVADALHGKMRFRR